MKKLHHFLHRSFVRQGYRIEKMTSPEEFREFGKAMIDYVADYLENIRDRPVLPSVKPGYLQQLVPEEAPEEPEKWQVSFSLLRRIMPQRFYHPIKN